MPTDLNPITQHDADVILGRLFPVPAADLTTIRALIRLRREQGWTVTVYGDRPYQDHVYSPPSKARFRPERLLFYRGELEYRRHGAGKASVIVPESMADVLAFLRLVGLLPAAERVAAAILLPDRAVTT